MGYRIKIGNIYEIPLPNGLNAYGRLFKEFTLAIYNTRAKHYDDIPDSEDYQCFIGVYKYCLTDGKWKVVGARKFHNEDEAWPPPQCVVSGDGKGSLYYKGVISDCTYEECKDLEIVAAWDQNQVVDRLMGDSKWEDAMRKPLIDRHMRDSK